MISDGARDHGDGAWIGIDPLLTVNLLKNDRVGYHSSFPCQMNPYTICAQLASYVCVRRLEVDINQGV